jgi:hypothetical protein
VTRQRGGGDRADAVELLGHLHPVPVIEPEVIDHLLLPLGLLGPARMREVDRRRDRQRQALAAGDVRRHGEHGRGVAAA